MTLGKEVKVKMNNYLGGILIFILGFLAGILFYRYIWLRRIKPWLSFQIQVLEHSWMHRTRRARIDKIREEGNSD